MRGYLQIIRHGRKYFWMGGVSLAFLFLYTIFSTFSLLSITPFLEILFNDSPEVPAPSAGNWFNLDTWKAQGYNQLYQAIGTLGKQQVLLYFVFFLSIVIILKNAARYFGSFFMAPLELHILANLRENIFNHLSKLSLSFYSEQKKGDLIGLMIGDVQVIQEAIISTLQATIREPVTMVVFLITLLLISWKLTLFTLIVLPLTALIISRIRGPLKRKTKEGQIQLGQLVALVDEFVSGVRIIKGFQTEAYERQRYANKNQDFTQTQIRIRRQIDLASPITEIISVLVIALIIYFAGTLIIDANSELKQTEFLTFLAIFSQFLAPIKTLSGAITKIQKANAAYERIEALLTIPPAIQEPNNPLLLSSFEKEITFSEVHFRYEEHPVLTDISFTLPKGKIVAIVGPSGAGKSTLVDLIPRFYDPQSGSITIDGYELRDLSLHNLRGLIGIVSQEGILFHDTVANNIAFGQEEVDMGRMVIAAEMAHAHEFIEALPQGYETMIGERGTKLSGGQRQRLSIARAIYRNAPILILDEATSNLDTQSEALVQQALDRLMEDRTTLVIAHRLTTIIHADQILVMQAGRIIAQGTHQELVNQPGLYRELYALQGDAQINS